MYNTNDTLRKEMVTMKTRDLVLCALMAAVICVCSMISVPIGEVSITIAVLGVLLTAVMLGWKRGFAATLVFILLGAVGLPVFSNMNGGIGVLAGPTGGYIYSYLIMALIAGFTADKTAKLSKKPLAVALVFAACIVSVAVCYALGTIQFMAVMKRGFADTLAVCVLPFIPFDIIKSVIASFLGLKLRSMLKL